MASYDTKGKTEATIIIAFIFSLILIPNIARLSEKPTAINPVPEEKRIRDRFSRLRNLDSATYWQGDRTWMKEYAIQQPMSLKEYIEHTNIRYKERILEHRYTWYNQYSKQKLSIYFRISEQDLRTSVSARESVRDFSKYLSRAHDYLINDYIIYSELFIKDHDLLSDFIYDLQKIPLTTADPRTEMAYNVITLIQSLEYINMKYYRLLGDSLIYCGKRNRNKADDCVKPINFSKFYYKGVKDNTEPEIRYIKHELFTPVEALTYGKADCDTRTLLAFTILKNLGYDVATMRIHFFDNGKSSWHGMLGIAGVMNMGPYFFTYKNKKYYYVELTRTNWWIGEITPDQKNYGRLIGLDLPVPAIRWGGLSEKK